MASELPIVTRLRSSICENKCKAMLASSGCDCAEAADIITELQLAGFAVWNNLLNEDIEAHTQQALGALQMLRYALAKAGGPINE